MATNPFEKFRTKIAEGLFALNTKLFADGEKVSGDNPLPMKQYGSNVETKYVIEPTELRDDIISEVADISDYEKVSFLIYHDLDVNPIVRLYRNGVQASEIFKYFDVESNEWISSNDTDNFSFEVPRRFSILDTHPRFRKAINAGNIVSMDNITFRFEFDEEPTEGEFWLQVRGKLK